MEREIVADDFSYNVREEGSGNSVNVGGRGCGDVGGGDEVTIIRLDGRSRCPDDLGHLLDPPADRDDAVAVLRWVIA
jgi:hypothetical protein